VPVIGRSSMVRLGKGDIFKGAVFEVVLHVDGTRFLPVFMSDVADVEMA